MGNLVAPVERGAMGEREWLALITATAGVAAMAAPGFRDAGGGLQVREGGRRELAEAVPGERVATAIDRSTRRLLALMGALLRSA